MGIKRHNLLSISLMGIILGSLIIPAYAEIQSIKTDKLFYSVGDKIIFSGTVEEDSTGLVTIVIRDSKNKFVLLTQALIQPNNTFERSVTVNEKFTDHGIYNTTAFLVNMTEGSLIQFDFSIDGEPVTPSISSVQSRSVEPMIQDTQVVNLFEPEPESKPISKIASFVDSTKDPQYYINRYNTEFAYKEWFDSNLLEQTIYEVVGIPMPEPEAVKANSTKNELPVATQETSANMVEYSTVSPYIDSSSTEFGQMLLALGGLGVLFGAVYGVKRRVDSNSVQIVENKTKLEKKVNNNSEQISQNRFWLKKKLMNLKSSDELITLIKERLAKGEISVEQYYKLLRALKR